MEVWSAASAVGVLIWADGNSAATLAFVWDQVILIRPIRVTWAAPASAKALTVSVPIPRPAPVMTIVLLAIEREGWFGGMAW